jgi:hypothetical protein
MQVASYVSRVNSVDRLNLSFQTLLRNHQTLKTQNDELLVRLGMDQQSVLRPILKGKQMEKDSYRGGLGEHTADEGETDDIVGLVGPVQP